MNNNIDILNICTIENNYSKRFFFDASEVINIIKGLSFYYESGTFSRQLYDTDKSIVYSLVFGNYLNNSIELLPSHQAELSSFLTNKAYNIDVNPKDFIEVQLKLKDTINIIKTSKSIINDNIIIIDLFKAIFLIEVILPKERILHLYESKILAFNDYNNEDIDIYDYNLFNHIFNTIENIEHRKNLSQNNYNDAVSLLYLAKQVKAFNENKTKIIPIYWDSQRFSDHMTTEVKRDYYTINIIENGFTYKHSVFRDSTYFKLSTIVKSWTHEPKYIEYRKILYSTKILVSISKDINDLNLLGKLLPNKFSEIKERINTILDDLIEYDFIKYLLSDIVANNLEKFDFKTNDFDINEINKRYDALIKVTIGNFYLLTSQSTELFENIFSRIESILKIYHGAINSGYPIDIFYDYSLFRFFIPESFQNEINGLFSKKFLFSDNQSIRKETLMICWFTVYKILNNNRRNDSSIQDKDYYLVFCLIWLLNLYDIVTKIEINYRDTHHSILMLKGACLNRLITEKHYNEDQLTNLKDDFEIIINELADRYKKYKISQQNIELAEICISLSYLYFQKWLINGNKLFVDCFGNYNNLSEDNKYAISYAKIAINTLKNLGLKEMRYVYSLNLFCYFCIDTGTQEEFLKISNEMQELMSFKNESRLWHYRFDDTLARNFLRKSTIVRDINRKVKLAVQAEEILENTLKRIDGLEGRDVKEVRNLKMKIGDYISTLNINYDNNKLLG